MVSLTHLPLGPRIYASVNWVPIGSDNGLAPGETAPSHYLSKTDILLITPHETFQWKFIWNSRKWTCQRNGGHFVKGIINPSIILPISTYFSYIRSSGRADVIIKVENMRGNKGLPTSNPKRCTSCSALNSANQNNASYTWTSKRYTVGWRYNAIQYIMQLRKALQVRLRAD